LLKFIFKLQTKKGGALFRGIVNYYVPIKKPRVVVLTLDAYKENALKAGKVFFLDEKILKKISEGKVEFSKLIATNESLNKLKHYAKILGPKGLMPNKKAKTLVSPEELENAVRQSLKGQMEFKINKLNAVNFIVGKRSFEDKKIILNIDAVLQAVFEKRPDGIRGNFIKKAYITTFQGKSLLIDPSSLEVGDVEYFLNESSPEFTN